MNDSKKAVEGLAGSDQPKLIYHHNAMDRYFYIGFTIRTLAVLAIALWINYLLLAAAIAFYIYFIVYRLKRKKSSYKIYEDRIEYFNALNASEVKVIPIKDIYQVRYEDDFGMALTDIWHKEIFIYLYIKPDHTSNYRWIIDNRVDLKIKNDWFYKDRIILILQFFQGLEKEVYIKTRHRRIKEALGLKDWDRP